MQQRININFSQEQSDALHYLNDHTTTRVLYGGQAGGGKSFLISMWQITQRLKYPGTRGYIGREILKNLKNSILITLMDCLKQLNVPHHYNDQKSFIDFNNGSRIVLLDLFDYPSDPNWDALGSTEYTDGAIEEGVNVSQRACDLLISRTRYKHDVYNLFPKQLITCNPSDSWVKDTIVVPHFENKLKPDTKFISATLKSNPNIEFRERYQKTLESLSDPYDKARLLHGDWFAQPRTGGEFYHAFKTELHTTDAAYNPELPLHISFDFNVVPYITATIYQMDQDDIVQIDEICLAEPRNNTVALCREITNSYGTHISGMFVYGDPAGKHRDTRTTTGHNDFDLIRIELNSFRPNMRVQSSAPSIVMRGNFINHIFGGKMENCSIKIGNNCQNSINDLNFVKMMADGTKHKKKERDRNGVSFERHGHCSDSLDYIITTVFKDQFNRFVKGNKPPEYKVVKRLEIQKSKY